MAHVADHLMGRQLGQTHCRVCARRDRWLRQHLVPSQVRVRVDIFNAVAAMLRTGVGVGVLPSFMQDTNPDLLPVSDVIPELSVPVWS